MRRAHYGGIGEATIIVLIAVILALPGWFVTSLLQGNSAGELRPIALVIGAVIVFLLVAVGLAFYLAPRGGNGNRRAVLSGAVAALVFLVIVGASILLTSSKQQAMATGNSAGAATNDAIPWGLAVTVGPALLLLALAWAAWRNRSMTPTEERRSERGTRELRDQIDAEDSRRDRGQGSRMP